MGDLSIKTREGVEAWLRGNGCTPRPRFPHIFDIPGKPDGRWVLKANSLRLESRTSRGEWVRVRSAYYKNLTLTPDNRISGLSVRGA